MNFLYCDYDLRRAAMAVDDKRLGTMIKESGQMISTARVEAVMREFPGRWSSQTEAAAFYDFYKPTHQWHPVTRWVCFSRRNQEMLLRYALHLCDVYEIAFGHRQHKSIEMIEHLDSTPTIGRNGPGTTPHNSARNEGKGIDFTHETCITIAYRRYMLARWATDARRCTWRGRTPPAWRYWPELGMTTAPGRRAS